MNRNPPNPSLRKGRGALSNPEGRFESLRVEPVDDGWSQHPVDDGEHAREVALASAGLPADSAEELPPLQTTVTAEPARSIITRNKSPDLSFEQSINPYRGCEHGCIYCVSGDTRILMGDGRTKSIARLGVGEEIYGTVRRGWYRRYVKSRVLAHWSVIKPAYRILLEDGTRIVAGGDHRFLTERGWKFVTGTLTSGEMQRPHLTVNNKLMGTGGFAPEVVKDDDYRRGYLCGIIRGDAHLGSYTHERAKGGGGGAVHAFRLALCDAEALQRTQEYLHDRQIGTAEFLFQRAVANREAMHGIRTGASAHVRQIRTLIVWPVDPTPTWGAGFLAGIFDAEGSYSQCVLRICNTDGRIIDWIGRCLRMFDFRFTLEHVASGGRRPLDIVRLNGGLREQLRFFHLADPAIRRKFDIEGQAVKSNARLKVVAVEPIGRAMRLYDITTETEDFIANGVIAHNCYARPAHSYVNLSPGLDFETKLFYKRNAAQLLEKELRRPGYVCKPINIGANTDPYQPIERRLNVTRSILEILRQFRHPVSIVTKGRLIERDIDILSDLARDELVAVYVSITTLDPALKRGLEPRAPSPAARLQAVQHLSNAGIPVGVLMAPIIPAVNDHEIEAVLQAVVRSGAQWAGHVMLRLPYEVKDLFREWLHAHLPLRADHVMSLVRQMRGGRDNDPGFGSRMRGDGVYAQLIHRRFEAACARLGLNRARRPSLTTRHFRAPPPAHGQMSLL